MNSIRPGLDELRLWLPCVKELAEDLLYYTVRDEEGHGRGVSNVTDGTALRGSKECLADCIHVHHVRQATVAEHKGVARLAQAHIEDIPTWGSILVAASTIAFLGFVLSLVMRDVLHGRRHVGEKVTGAIVAYLLIGLMWSFAFGLVELARPGSCDIPGDMIAAVESDPGQRPTSIFVYYSYITLTTLGYGDITPVGHAARTLSWLEAVIGQLFVAVTIARLVGIHASVLLHSSPESSDELGR